MILHRNGAHGMSERPNVFSLANPVLEVAVDRPILVIFATCACFQEQHRTHNLSPRRIFLGLADGEDFSVSPPRQAATMGCALG
jgi:hypothetical protein